MAFVLKGSGHLPPSLSLALGPAPRQRSLPFSPRAIVFYPYAMSSNSHKRAVLTEELVSITGGPWEALLLRQLLYWLPRRKDIDDYIKAESEKVEEPVANLTGGWIYKGIREWGEEIMCPFGESALRKRMKALSEAGFVEERESPTRKWDKRLQYRPDVVAIEEALREEGHTLKTVMGADYGTVAAVINRRLEQSDRISLETDRSTSETDRSTSGGLHARDHIPETTTETTAEKQVEFGNSTSAPGKPNADKSQFSTNGEAKGGGKETVSLSDPAQGKANESSVESYTDPAEVPVAEDDWQRRFAQGAWQGLQARDLLAPKVRRQGKRDPTGLLDSWADTFRLLHERDEYTVEQIRLTMRFFFQEENWWRDNGNIKSANTLRSKVGSGDHTKFDNLHDKAKQHYAQQQEQRKRSNPLAEAQRRFQSA